MKKNIILIISIILIVIFALSFTACKKKNTDNKDYAAISDDIAMTVIISEEVIETQQEIDQKGVFTKYEFAKPTGITEGLISLFVIRGIDYTYNGSMYTKMGKVELSPEDITSGYRIVVYTTVTADQNTTDSAKKIKFGTYNLVQTNKAPDELSIPQDGNNVILIAKVKV